VTEAVDHQPPRVELFCLGVDFIVLSRRRPNVRETWTCASLGQFLLILPLIPAVLNGAAVEWRFFTIFPGVDFFLRIDAFGLLFALTSSFLWILVSVYSIGYLRTLEEHAQTRYYCCFSLAILGAVGVAFSGNLVTFYIFYELLTISTYPLVSHEQTPEALFAGRKYLVYLLTAGCFLLAAVAWTYSMTGETDFVPGGILSISANGSTPGSGIVWASHPMTNANHATSLGVLRAYDAANVGIELWNSTQNLARDDVGDYAKFSPPTIANGKVYLATFSNQLAVYGLNPPQHKLYLPLVRR
jgi:hypothetical protein